LAATRSGIPANADAEIAADSATEATFVLKRPQPAILALIASGYTAV